MIRSARPLIALAVACAAGVVPAACGGDKKPAESPNTPVASSAPTTTSTAPAPADAGPMASGTAAVDAGPPPPPLAQVLTTDPGQLAALLTAAQSAPSATLQPLSAGAGDPVEAGIKSLAASNAKGMQPDGQMARGDLKEGDHLSMLVNLQAGRCYTIIGFSPKGQIQDLDLRLLAPPFYNVLSGEDTTDDNAPMVGKAPGAMCPVIPIPIANKVDIHAQKGAGKAGVQVYSKPAK
jgi:hypothetical protein